MQFVCTDAKRERLKLDLAAYIRDGELLPTRLRRHTRIATTTFGHFLRANGDHVQCDVIDISLEGVSLRTKQSPPLGEIINLGQTRGRVVRHYADGIAVHFLSAVPNEEPSYGT